MHIFEALPGYIEHIQEKFATNRKVKVHPYGLFERDTSETLTVVGPGSSLYNSRSNGDQKPNSVNVQLRDIKGVMDEIGAERIDLLKINIEGAEFPLLKRLIDAGYLHRFDHIMVQYHEFAPYANWQRFVINKRLAESHHRVWNYPFVWEKWSIN